MDKKTRTALFLFLLFPAAALAQKPEAPREVQPPPPAAQPSDSEKLEQEWESVKAQYRDKFKAALDAQEKRIHDLEHQLDNGDKALRDRIADEVSQARKDKERLERRHDELKAAGVVDLMNLKNRMTDWMKKEA